jgi:hypothetical protein
MLALASVGRRTACAVATALLMLGGTGAPLVTIASAARGHQVAPAQHGEKLELAFGDIELAIAPTWTVSYDEGVDLNCPTQPTLVLVTFTSPSPGNPPRPECGGGPATTTVLAWYPAAAQLGRASLKTINGIAVQGPVPRGRWSEYSLPAQHYVFYAEGPDGTAIVRTVSYSARASLAHLTPVPPIPKSWKRLTADGLRFDVPASWPVSQRSGQSRCEFGAPLWDLPGAAVIYHGPQSSPGGCSGYFGSLSGPAFDEYPQFWGDGVVVSYPAQAPLGISAIWGIAPQSDVCSHAHGLTICPAAGDNTLYGPALFTIKRSASQRVVSLTVGLEGDGSVARTIIGSFEPA